MCSNPFDLSGKTVLVTGASSGIGQEIALSANKIGASLIVNGRNESRLNETVSKMSGGVVTLPLDLTDFDSVPDAVSTLPRLDGVVCCAGINERILAKNVTVSDINRTMSINFYAPVLLISELLRQKKVAKGASIVLMASLGAESPSLGNSIYSASKGALISYSKCLMLELAPRQIRVNCISPGMVWTDLIMDNSITVEQLREDEKKYPLQRYGSPEDIAGLALYLLSDASKWMTGSNIKISGGAL